MIGMIGAQEWLIILAIVLLLFGGTKLPELARSLGQAKREFEKSASSDGGSKTETEKETETETTD